MRDRSVAAETVLLVAVTIVTLDPVNAVDTWAAPESLLVDCDVRFWNCSTVAAVFLVLRDIYEDAM